MRVQVLIIIAWFAATLFAGLKHNLAAVYVAAGATMIIYMLYTIEMKIDKMLAGPDKGSPQ
jgi:hypothetical protein